MPSKIPYCDEVLEVTGGCTKCSPGCQNCWAIKEVWRMAHNPKLGDKWQGLVEKTPPGLNWTGRIKLFEAALSKPLRRKKPTTYFIDSKADLFRPKVPFEFIAKVWDIIFECHQHVFLILTKRTKRLAEFCKWLDEEKYRVVEHFNLHLGVSISTQKEADEKIPILLQIPAAVRFVSLEPMLERIDLFSYPKIDTHQAEAFSVYGCPDWYKPKFRGIGQVIIGAESINGKAGRPCSLDDIRFSVFQCKAVKVPCYLKQVHLVTGGGSSASTDGRRHREECKAWTIYKLSKKMAEWPQDLRVQEYPEGKE